MDSLAQLVTMTTEPNIQTKLCNMYNYTQNSQTISAQK